MTIDRTALTPSTAPTTGPLKPLTAKELHAHPAYSTNDWSSRIPPTSKDHASINVRSERPGGLFKMYYELHGQGPIKLVWIMGLGAYRTAWKRQSKYFGHDRGDKYTCLVFDNRGVGLSEKPWSRYTTREMAADLVELLEHLGWLEKEYVEKVMNGLYMNRGAAENIMGRRQEKRHLNVIGVSMGGMIAQEVAMLIPERIQSLFLVSTASRIVRTVPFVENLRQRINMFVPKDIDVQLEEIAHRLFSKDFLQQPDKENDDPKLNFPTNRDRFAASELEKRQDKDGFTKKGFVLQAIAAGWHHKSASQLKEIVQKVGADRICVMHGSLDNMITFRHFEIFKEEMASNKPCTIRHIPFSVPNSLAAHPPRCATHAYRRPYTVDNQKQASVEQTGNEETPADDVDVVLEDELLAIQDAAIAELEAKLGKTLQEAIEQDQFAQRLLALQGSVYDATAQEEPDVDPAEVPLVMLRLRGASDAEVAREARTIYGDYLRSDTLRPDELSHYKRLYGDPLVHPDEEEAYEEYEEEEEEIDQVPENVLFDQAGTEVPYRLESEEETPADIANQAKVGKPSQREDSSSTSRVQRPVDVARAGEVARILEADLVDEDVDDLDEEFEESEDSRSHPLTALGRFATYPKTTFLPKETFVQPVEKVLKDYSNKHLKEACERTFGGPGLPDSPLTPRSARARQQLPLPIEASDNAMGQMEANAFITSIMPPTYASISATLVETRKRLGSSWLNKVLAKPGGPRVLDAGSGGVGIVAWREIVQAHWQSLHTSDKGQIPKAPQTKSVVLTGSDNLRHRAATMLENTTFVPRLPDVVRTRQAPTLDDDRPAQQRKQFDVIIASHSIFPLKEEWERKQHIQNLWSLLSDEGGVLILIEKGIPRGFEAIAAAREMILESYLKVPEGHKTFYSSNLEQPSGNQVHTKVSGMIVAPCTNHDRCPMYRTAGLSQGRKDICSFQQRYIRPPFLQRVLGAKDRNHDDVDFSYISIMKGEDLRDRAFTTWEHVSDPMSAPAAQPSDLLSVAAFQQASVAHIQKGFEHHDPTWSDSPAPPPTHILPRILGQPLKRRGHITIDLCTPQAEIRRWTIPKSFSRQAYRDARKARWGDLWALGAKTNISRNLKLGTPAKDMAKGEGLRSTIGKPRSSKERLEMQAAKALEAEEEASRQEELEEEEFMKMLEEDNLLDEADEDDDDVIDMDTLLPKKASKSQTQKKKPAFGHAKFEGVNIFPPKSATGRATPASTSAGRTSSSSKPQNKQSAPPPSSRSSSQSQHEPPPDYNRRRYGSVETDNLSEWASEIESSEMDDEARRHLAKTGRRASSKNTFRLKRDLRRVRREQGDV
ncbi:37S ribosomal protein S22 [Lithohypha guttulata]|nr:37S ribosomal protein S22 [Lithohypha guttulata]